MTARVRICPVCWQRAIKAPSKRVTLHWDSIGRDICPGSKEPWRITIPFGAQSYGRAIRLAKVPA